MRLSFALLFVGLVVAVLAATTTFNVDTTRLSPFPHYWENCVGSCHALMGLRADWREHMKKAHDELGFKRVRMHGLLDDDMSVLLNVNQNGTLELSLYNVFSVFDFLLSIDMRPIIELSFMPEALASTKDTIFHYKGNISPPKDFAQWNELITKLMQGLIARYGIDEIRNWPMEVWNEPNCGFFTGTQAQYFQILENTFRAIKAVDPHIPVGGPATCQSAWIAETVAYCKQHGFKLDFLSTHEYPTDIMPVKRDIMLQVVKQSVSQADGIPVYYTEFNDGLYYGPSYHDRPYAASFIMQNIYDVQGLIDVFSWWTFTDIFEEGGQESDPFFKGDGWGLLSLHGVPKPSYRAFQLLHQLGTDQAAVTVSKPHPTLQMFAVMSANHSEVTLIIYNHQVIGNPITTETAQITINGAIGGSLSMRIIDDNHANAPAYWETVMGQPKYPTKAQIAELIRRSEMTATALPHTRAGANSISFSVTLMPQAVVAVTVPLA